MANEGFMLAALGGLALFALFRKPGGAPPPNGGQEGFYGGGSLGDFAADATIRADEASGVGKVYWLEPDLGLQTKAPGALGSGGMGPATAPVTTNLTSVPMLGVGALGDYVEMPLDMPPGSITADEDIGQAPWIAAGLMFGGSNTDAAPTSITVPPSSVPVINQTIFEVDIATTGHVSETIKPTQEQPGMIANVRTANIDMGRGPLDDFIPPVSKDIVQAPWTAAGLMFGGSNIAVDTFPTLAQVGTSDSVWIDAHVKESITRITNLRRAQGQAPPSAAYKARMASEIRAANVDLPVYS